MTYPQTPKPTPIPMAIVTGYLGTGKTTFVNRILASEMLFKIAVLVDDVGSVNIDQRFIAKSDDDFIELENGCVCRSIKNDLIQALKQVIEVDSPPELIIYEANGVSDPAGVVLKLNRSVLRNQIAIDTVIAVIDAESYHSTQTPNDLLRKQVQFADVVIINKADLVDVDELNSAYDWVESVVNRATIYKAVYCDVPLTGLLKSGTFNPQTAVNMGGHGVHVHSVKELEFHEHNTKSLVFATWCWDADHPSSLTVLRNVLNELPLDIFRIKGVLYLRDYPDDRITLQVIGNYVELKRERQWSVDENRETQVMFLGREGSVNEITLQTAMLDTLVKAIPARDLPTFQNDKIVWQRG